MRLIRSLTWTALWLGSALVASAPGFAQESLPTVTIGLVSDGEFDRRAEIPDIFVREMRQLLATDFRVRAPAEKQLVAGWSKAGAASALDRLLADAEVDFVLVVGPVSAYEAVSRTDLPKLVVAVPIYYTEWQDLPRRGEGSGVPNLHYLALTPREELVAFREVVPFDTVAVLVDEALAQVVPAVADSVRAASDRLDIHTKIIPLGRTIDPALPWLDEVDAVYLLSLLQLPALEFDRLIEAMIERGLPSFTAGGRADVEAGVLAGLRPTKFLQQVARRAALNVQRILLGGDASQVPVFLKTREALAINVATARAIGRYPTWKVLIEAELVEPNRRTADQTWSLETAVREAISVNRDLAARDLAVDAGGEDVSRATSFLLPQIDVSADGVIIDDDRTGSIANVAERTLSASGTVSQQIFDEPTWANRSVQSSVQRSRELERDALELDVAVDAAVTYLNVLRAKSFERIQQKNLGLTRTNLELAGVRQAAGTATAGEVYRWETEIANARQAVIDAISIRNQAEIELNRLLSRPLEESFLTEDMGLGGAEFLGGRERLLAFIGDPWSFRVFRGFMSEEALTNAPELQAIDALASAQDRAASSAGRRLWIPSLGLQAGVTEILNQSGAGSEDPPFEVEGFPVPDDTDWFVGLRATYPLFEGGARLADRRQARKELASLETEREAVADRVEQRVRVALHDLGASLVGIDLSRAAADAAQRNYELVQEAYSRGAISIIDLLDAQNVALIAEESAADAVFDFLSDLMRAQRASGRMDVLSSAEERDAFFARAEAYFAAAGVAPPER